MMSCSPRTTLFRLFLVQVATVWTNMKVNTFTSAVVSLSEGAVKIQLQGVVGGSVTFPCGADTPDMEFAYLQRGSLVFVNGFYRNRPIPTLPWNNTRMDTSNTVVHMHRLNVSHSGDYQCYRMYSGGRKVDREIHLSVTGIYTHISKPLVDSSRLQQLTCWKHTVYKTF